MAISQQSIQRQIIRMPKADLCYWCQGTINCGDNAIVGAIYRDKWECFCGETCYDAFFKMRSKIIAYFEEICMDEWEKDRFRGLTGTQRFDEYGAKQVIKEIQKQYKMRIKNE